MDKPSEYIPFASQLLRFQASDAFIVEAKGDGMLPKIKSGDMIIADRQTTAKNGDMIVCLVNGKCEVKVYWCSEGVTSLCRLNGRPIVLKDTDEFIIRGIVRNIFSYEN